MLHAFGALMIIERIENLLYEKFYRLSKFRLPDDAGILTAANDYMFPGFQFLYYSLKLSHEADICLIDCGLAPCQRQWCIDKGVQVVVLKPEDMPFSGNDRDSHLWNKGTYVEKSPFRKTLWLDSDCVVQDNLNLIFDLLETGPVFTEDHFAPKALMPNKKTLYEMMTIYPHKRSLKYINSGVMAFDKERDQPVLDAWRHCVEQAAGNKAIKASITWHDQGALMWAVEKCGLTGRIRSERAFNCPATKAGTHWGDAQVNPEGFLNSVHEDACLVKHFLSHPKPWHHWRRGVVTIELKDSFASKVKVFVLGHQDSVLDLVPNRPYFEKINLEALPIDRFQTNLLAESRIFLAPFLHRQQHEYIGFASARWNDKYAHLGAICLEDFHNLKVQLKPNNVLVAQRTDNINGPLGSFDPVNWRSHMEFGHKGISVYLEELSKASGIDNRRPSFWANNFICHRTVFKDFLKHWLDMFFYFYGNYKFDYKFQTADSSRGPAFLMEAITINYFSSRSDLNIVEARKDSAYKLM